MSLIRLVYLSAASNDFSQKELNELLEISCRNNEANNITGMLLYRDGDFLQILEGEQDSVLSTYNRIHKDPRHHGLLQLDKSEIHERGFPKWSMGFKRLDKTNTPSVFVDFFDRNFNQDSISNRSNEALTFLNSFKQLS